MAPIKCTIKLNNILAAYHAGDMIRGYTKIIVDDPRRIKSISAVFKGETCTKWTSKCNYEITSPMRFNCPLVENSAREEYFNMNYYLFDSQLTEGTLWAAGSRLFNFSFLLPYQLPTSFEGEHGYVRYSVKIIIDLPDAVNLETKMAYSVIGFYDLNETPHNNLPMKINMEKSLCCLFCKSDALKVDVSTPCSGFVPGQVVPVTINCENGTGTDVRKISVELKQIATYRCTRPVAGSITDTRTVAEITTLDIPPYSTLHIKQGLAIPPVAPSELRYSSYIDLEYKITVKCIIAGMHFDMEKSAPVNIGTVTLRNFSYFETYQIFDTSPEHALPNDEPYHSSDSDDEDEEFIRPRLPRMPSARDSIPSRSQSVVIPRTTPAIHVQESGSAPFEKTSPLIKKGKTSETSSEDRNSDETNYAEIQFPSSSIGSRSILDEDDNGNTVIVGSPNFKPKYLTMSPFEIEDGL